MSLTPIAEALMRAGLRWSAAMHRGTYMCKWVFLDDMYSRRVAAQQGTYWGLRT
jgi:hypothetical protein